MLDVSIVFLQTSKITQRDDRVLLSRPFSRHLAPFPPNFPIQRPSNTYIYIYIQYTYIYIYIYTYVHIYIDIKRKWLGGGKKKSTTTWHSVNPVIAILFSIIVKRAFPFPVSSITCPELLQLTGFRLPSLKPDPKGWSTQWSILDIGVRPLANICPVIDEISPE